MRSILPLLLAASFLVACDDEPTETPVADAAPRVDAEIDMEVVPPDMGGPTPDGAVVGDMGTPVDAGDPDQGTPVDQGPRMPACADGADNDADGLIDLADPGCSSAEDEDETDPPRLCGNGLDDDADGFIDVLDPGCESDTDFTEEDPERRPACANGFDDDEDALVDLSDPGCQAAGDTDEADEIQAPACSNGDDDDADGRTDFPNDPGCGGPGDSSEADPATLPACGNGADDDGDGTTDFPADEGCLSAGDYDERLLCVTGHELGDLNAAMAAQGFADGTTAGAPEGQRGTCGGDAGGEVMFAYDVATPLDRVVFSTLHAETVAPTVLYIRSTCEAAADLACNRGSSEIPGTEAVLERPEPGTYFVVVDTSSRMIGPGAFRLTATEIPRTICDDGIDNDVDGDVDFPNDPGCIDPDDGDETDPDPLPACADGIDNDADEAIDFPADPECASAAGDAEAQPGCMSFPNLQLVDNQTVRLELAPMGASAYQGTCGGGGAPEEVVLLRVRQASRLRVETVPAAGGQTYDTLLYMRANTCDMGAEVDCDDDGGEGTRSLITAVVMPGDYYIFSDGFGAGSGPIGLDIVLDPLGAACGDGIDNDEDGLADGEDLGCAGADDEDEADDGADPTACNDAADNDADGLADYPLDPGCGGRGDNDEADPAVAPECADGADNDEDGLTDYPLDPGCASAGDDRESDPVDRPACANGIDDDADRLIDLNDPGCGAAGDSSEAEPEAPGACLNGVDDDADGATDFPFDPGCAFPGDLTETNLAVAPVCANGADDDMDGTTDFPNDPGCAFAADPDEANPGVAPACANGNDDDADALIDFPNDPGCFAAGDTSEVNPAACANGVDDDNDGSLDLADPGCVNVVDNDETDPDEDPACADGLDNDGDGAIDYPDDADCPAAGGRTEALVCGEIDVPTIFVGQAGGVVNFVPRAAAGQVLARCGFNQEFGSETLIVLTLDEASHVQVNFQGSVRRYLRTVCDDPNSEVQCVTPASTTALSLFAAPPGNYYIFVEPNLDQPAPVTATILVTPVVTDCNNGEDDDADGLVDAFDGGCRDAFDTDETDRDPPAACDNGEDDDADGQIDYPNDPECRYAGAAQEGRRCPGLDLDIAEFDDEGGRLIFRLDEGAGAAVGSCSAGGASEQVLAVTVDERSTITVTVRDGDGPASVAMYARRDCLNPASELGCNTTGGILTLNDVAPGTYYVVIERSAFTAIEPLTATVAVQSTITACNDGVDSDDDGLVDLADPGCTSGNDGDEADPAELPLCLNQVDDDADGLIDFPNDFGCVAAGDPTESLACVATDDVIEVLVQPGPDGQRFPYDTTGGASLFGASCGSNAASAEQVFALVVPVAVTGFIEIADFQGDSVLHIRRECDNAAAQIACDDDGADVGLLSRLRFVRLEPGIYYVFADGFGANNAGPGTLLVNFQQAPAACADGNDNDADNLTDLADPGCESPEDDSEFNEALPACSNRVDDDVDTLIDLDDPGCVDGDDNDEFNERLPECSNRLDDDGDARIDANDPGCDSPEDEDEFNPPFCSDEQDNDGDALIDLADPGCTGVGDDDETDPAEVAECADGVDNDGDGATDWPEDAECLAAGGISEVGLCLGAPDATVVEPGVNGPVVYDFDTTGRANAYQATCGSTARSPDQVFVVVVDVPVSARFEITASAEDTVIHVRSACDDAATELDCDDDGGQGVLSLAQVARLEPGIYFVIVDGYGVGNEGPGQLTIELTAL